MNNYLDLLAIESTLDVTVNGQHRQHDLQQPLKFNANDTVVVDGIEILPHYRHLVAGDSLEINEPFYCWYHRISGQGWLLEPQ